jgi:microcystin degradation protein MlrC
MPIIAIMDPHVNLSPAMVQACDGMVAYRENPHLDQRQRGIEAAKIMVRTVRGEIAPVAAAVFPPIAINIERQLTSVEPMLSVQRELEVTRALPGILSASVTLGFPYADVPEMGSAFVVVADGNPELAEQEAKRLGNWLREHRERFRGEMVSPEEALARVADSPRPVGLLDMGDNVGGGGPGDSTVLAGLALREQRWRILFYVPDVESVEAAVAAGIGGKIRLKLGGKLPMTPAGPLDVEASVISFHDGHFSEKEVRHGGKTGGSMGPCAVVQVGDYLTVLLTTLREGGCSFSIQPLLSCGLNPADYDIIIIKGVHAPVAAYTSVCPTLIRVNTPGVTCADLQTLNFCHRRVPLFPFEEV